MPWKIEVGGVDRTSEMHQGSGVFVELIHNERGTARFTTLPGYIPALREGVLIYDQDGTTPIFGGVIFQRETRGEGSHTFAICECADWTWYLDRITIPEVTFPGGTLNVLQVLQWFQTNHLAAYGFTLDPGQETGPTLVVSGFTWERRYVSDALREVSIGFGGWLFQVDPDMTWRMVSPSTVTPTAPFTITDGNSNARVLEWRETSEHYATKVILRAGGTGTREATQSWTVDAQIISDGYVETFAPSTPTGGVAATINSVPATVGTSGTQLIWDWETHRLTAGTYVPVLGDVVSLTYTAQYPFEVVADSGITPPIEIVEAIDDMTDAGTAQAMADGKLLAAFQSPRTFEIDSVVDGLRPGQVISINSTYRSTVSTALITRVTISMVTNDVWTYRAEATSGIYAGSGLDFWRSLGGGTSSQSAVLVTYSGGTPPGIAGAALTKTDDANVTLTLGGSPETALLAATSLTLGWTGVLAPSRLNASVVQSVVNDTNIIGSINAQALTLGWAGQLAVPRGGTGLASVDTGRLLYGAGTSPLQTNAVLNFDGQSLNTHSLLVSTGNANFAASAHPVTNYLSNLGSLSRKYLSLHAAELFVETLVAQDTMATIGGRILVAPTTVLTVDLAPGDTTLITKHNNLAVDDFVRMEAGGRLEWMQITGGPTGGAAETRYHPLVGLSSQGPATNFSYTVTRDLDGTGANQWYAGDAIINTGVIGDGFIDLYSYSGVLSGFGPTIVGNVRTGMTYSNVGPRWAIGNLNGLYGYSGDVYGAAFGVPTLAWIKIDESNGIRIGHNTTTKVHIDASGNATFAGALSAATGTFAGSLSAATGSFSTGAISLDTNGVTIAPSSTVDDARSYKFTNSGTQTGRFGVYGYNNSPLKFVGLQSINIDTATANDAAQSELMAATDTSDTNISTVTCFAGLGASLPPYVELRAKGATTVLLTLNSADGVTGVNGAMTVGAGLTVTGTSALAGITASGQMTLSGNVSPSGASIAHNTTNGVTIRGSSSGSAYHVALLANDGTVAIGIPGNARPVCKGLRLLAGVLDFDSTHGSGSATAGAASLPSNPVGFMTVSTDDGTAFYKLPLYNT